MSQLAIVEALNSPRKLTLFLEFTVFMQIVPKTWNYLHKLRVIPIQASGNSMYSYLANLLLVPFF